jgi:hypothetical protein
VDASPAPGRKPSKSASSSRRNSVAVRQSSVKASREQVGIGTANDSCSLQA